jgi:hypothetical protein
MIRAPVTSDRARWQVLWDGYNAFYGRAGATALPAQITDYLRSSARPWRWPPPED